MGWIAAGCCTLIAGYVICTYFFKDCVEKESVFETPTKSETAVVPDSQVMQDGEPQLAPEMTLKKGPTVPPVPLLDTRPPKAEESTPPARKAEMPLVKTPETPQISRPTPPSSAPPIRPSSPPRLKPPSFGNLAPPPRPGNGFIRPPPSAAASLRVPPTKPLLNASTAPTSSIMPPGRQVSRKVILEPGHSPLDWAALISNPNSRLRGKDAPENLIRVTPTQLKLQNGRKGRDAWTVFQGKVYNITSYVPFHPGGKGEIMRGAGKDSDKLFMETHPWVNWDGMLGECLVGILVGDDEETDKKNGSLDDMD